MSQSPEDPSPRKFGPSDATRFHPFDGSAHPLEETDFEIHDPANPSNDGDFSSSDFDLKAVLGEYLMGKKIGSGGMGHVFRAVHRTMQREVAIKILPKSLSQHPELVDRFYAEIRAVAKLMHPNIVTAFDAGQFQSVHYLVMELIEGIPLSHRLHLQGPSSQNEVVQFLAQAASALAYAHDQGVIHRDIKPSNLILSQQGTLKILDFGLAQLAEEVRPQGKRRQLLGTVEFMSPEQVEHPDHVDHRTDLYSLGATAYFLLMGRPMFEGEPVEIALAHLKKIPTPIYELRGDIDLRISAIIERLVAKHPDDRFSNAQAIIEHLQAQGLLENQVERTTPISLQRAILPTDSLTRGPQHQSTNQVAYAAVGIELGAYHSRASFINPQKELIEVPVAGNAFSLRNMIWCDGERLAIGEPAMQLRAKYPDQVFHVLQRFIGFPVLDRPFAGRNVPPEILLAVLLHRLFDATKRLSTSLTHAVVNVPACYDQLHRNAIATACRCAGIEVLQLLDKPLAAALAHLETQSRLEPASSTSQSKEHWVVVMLSGTACEASVLEVQGLEAKMIATNGDWKRGLGRWQRRLAEYLAIMFQQQHGLDLREDLVAVSRLQRSCEIALDRLSVAKSIDIHYEWNQRTLDWKLDRDSLPQFCGDLFNDLIEMPKAAIEAAKIDPHSVKQLLLIGDLFKIPSLRVAVRRSLYREIPYQVIEKEDLARGAALQAEFLMPPTNPDGPHAITASSYDIGFVLIQDDRSISQPRVLIPKGTPLPTQFSRTLKFAAGTVQPKLLQFVEGTREGHPNWHRLGGVQPAANFPRRAPEDPLQLRLDLDLHGLLSGKLTWPAGNQQASIQPLADPGMDPGTIQQWRDWIDTLMLCQPIAGESL